MFSVLLRPWLEPDVLLFFIAAVWCSAWLHGWGGGVAAIAGSAVAYLYFFIPPSFSFAISGIVGFLRLLAFVAVCGLITWITVSWRRTRGILPATLLGIGDAVIVCNTEGAISFLNAAAENLTGWTRQQALGQPAADVMRLIDEGSREPVENPLLSAMRDRATVTLPADILLVSKQGSEVPIENTAGPVRGESGIVAGAVAVFRDISARRHLEEQLTQSQKMEAVGRLAAGVAGDFNNVLTVITGYAELLRAELPSNSPLRRFADEVIYAGERAASLTRQLLTFGRSPAAQPRPIDLNSLVANMDPMLRRIVGENIELILLSSPGLGRIKADPTLMEQAIVNLVTNARDAMPKGGKLVIETANVDLDDAATSKKIGVKPGSYVMLAVSDTGVGMDAVTRSRLFEPFFTTKEPGKGSGLGLSAVYGIIRQSEGQVTVYSQPDCGTIFEIYLPRVKEAAAVIGSRKTSMPKGSETILLVDDEEGVRKLVYAILKSQGYDVLEAGNGSIALSTWEKNAHKIDLVLTDVVMPQMNGFELGQHLMEKAPGLKILYMSGYRDTPVGTYAGDAPRAFLHKPFTPDGLLTKVREVLDT